VFSFCSRTFIDADRTTSITAFGGGGGGVGTAGGNGFYPENYVAQQQHRHGMVDDSNGGLLFCTGFPVSAAAEPQHIRLQSPPLHRLNHRNRNLHHNGQQRYENTAGTWHAFITVVWRLIKMALSCAASLARPNACCEYYAR